MPQLLGRKTILVSSSSKHQIFCQKPRRAILRQAFMQSFASLEMMPKQAILGKI